MKPTNAASRHDSRIQDDPRYAEEACPGGDGDLLSDGTYETCEWCNGTGMVYTQEAIRLQIEQSDAWEQRTRRIGGDDAPA